MELGNLKGLVISVMIIGLVLGVGFLLLREFADTMGTTVYDGSAINETIGSLTANGVYVAHNHTNMNCFHDFSVTQIFNATGELLITAANYSYEATTGKIWNLTPDVTALVPHTWMVNYRFEYSNSTGCAGMEETVNATEKIQEWLGIIVIMFLVGILLFIVYKFAFPSMGGGKVGGGEKFKFKGFGGGGSGDSGSAEI